MQGEMGVDKFRSIIFCLSLTSVILLLTSCLLLHAVPPPPGFPHPDQPPCHVNAQAVQERLAVRSRYAPGMAAPISAATYKVAVLRIDFSDYVMTTSTDSTKTFFENMRSFYAENSYSLVTVTATVSTGGTGAQGSFRMPNPLSFYASGINSKYSQLASHAITAANNAGFSFSGFNHIMIYHAGEGSETSLTPNSYIWSVFIPDTITAGSNNFSGITFVPEKEFDSSGGTSGTRISPLGVICHEYGHQLGLPDLYNTGNGSGGTAPVVGKWSLMDYGIYIGSPPGSNPAHLDAWSKLFLGFSSPETVTFTLSTDKNLTQAELGRTSFIRLPISISDVGGTNEYFLAEYRRTSGASYDNAIPGSGLIIYHIDDSIASNATRLASNNINNGSPHHGVAVIEADSSNPSKSPYGDSGDPWSSSSTNFTGSKALAYNGNDSGVTLSNFRGAGTSAMTITVQSLVRELTVRSDNVVVSGGPNGYVNPNNLDIANIQFIPTSAGTVKLKIYTLNGELVWERSKDVTDSTQIGNAQNKPKVTWDGKNADGTIVASGIYILHVSGGGLDVKKKIAVIK